MLLLYNQNDVITTRDSMSVCVVCSRCLKSMLSLQEEEKKGTLYSWEE